ncbi:MAG: efflux RND transporter permease subunit, partial [Chitinivibrionales bacterium]
MGINVGKFSVHNPVLINIVMVAILALGTFSLMRLPREQFSEIPFYWVNITVPYPGVSAEDIEQNITSEIEEQLRGLPDLDQITSTTREGMAMVQVEFEEGISDTRFQQLYQRTQTEFNKVELPEDALEPVISDFSSADFVPVVEVILAGNVGYRVLDRQSELLRDRILEVEGVSDVERIGGREQELQIAVDRQKAEALQISLEEIVSAVRLANATIPAGNLTTTTREYVVRTVGELTEASQFERILVRKLPSGEAISVGELATVRDTFERASVDQRYNGMPAITLRVSKRTAADALEIVAQIREIVQDYRVLLPAGVGLYLFNDSTVQIKDSLRMLITNAITGFVLVVLTLFAFLGFRNAFVTALGIPLTFALTFMFMDFYGESLNGNSLFALVLVLGLIVDHAIIIVENSYRYRQQGIEAEPAAITGTNQVVKPVIAATLTTVAAFLPLMLVPGTIGKFLR